MTNRSTDKSPKVFVIDDLHPEDGAMLQALYSRSPAGVMEHLEKVRGAGSGKFMSRYYVGYGHASIGDCGTTNVFIENYSMLAAKAIQDNPLYSGQEASTRYLDFSVQPMKDPYDHPASAAILDGWMDLYNKFLPRVKEALAQRYPFDSKAYKSEKMWENAVEARAFDTMRGFLPLGTTTLLSWSTNLRQARDRMMAIKNHPLPEVRDMAKTVFKQLIERYPHSFNGNELDEGEERYAERDAWYKKHALRDHFQSWADIKRQFEVTPEEEATLREGGMVAHTETIDIDGMNHEEADLLKTRPKGAALPRRLAAYGHYNLIFLLDFGSYRDIQRHRNGVCQIPLVDETFGMFNWYTDELKNLLNDTDFTELNDWMNRLYADIATLGEQGVEIDPLKSQYLYPMGTAIACQVSYSVPQMIYVGELRSGKTVHASLRPIAQNMARVLQGHHPDIALYIDWDEDSWSAKRGEQTIAEKKAS